MKILSEIKNYDKSVIFFTLGKFGLNLYDLAQIVDTNHPDINNFPIDMEISKKILQFLELVKYAFDKNLNESINGIHKFFMKSISIDLKLEKCVRFIKDNNKKLEIRLCNKAFDVNLDNIDQLWENSEDNFEIYEKNSIKRKIRISDLLEKSKHYLDIGCDLISENIKKRIDKLSDDSYCGFNRIFLKDASIITAKIYKLNLKEDSYVFRMLPISKLPNELFELEENFSFFDYYYAMSFFNSNKSTNSIIVGQRNGLFYFLSSGSNYGSLHFLS